MCVLFLLKKGGKTKKKTTKLKPTPISLPFGLPSHCVLHATQVNLLQLSGLQREEFVKELAAQPELLAEVAKLQAKAPVKAERGEGSCSYVTEVTGETEVTAHAEKPDGKRKAPVASLAATRARRPKK